MKEGGNDEKIRKKGKTVMSEKEERTGGKTE